MRIFNSLGSNYNFSFVLKTLFAKNDNQYSKQLEQMLEDKYSGQAILTYKGREAITLALQILNLSREDFVAINGFTCYAVYKAIKDAGVQVEYLDINKDLNFSAETFKKSLSKNQKIKAVIIQNTLGYPADIAGIAKICKEKKIILIEDLAHSIGTKYEEEEAGNSADFTILSFSQDKMIDGISGGALIIRNKSFQTKFINFDEINFSRQIIDRLYPFFTYLIRKTYSIGIGKILHKILKGADLLSKPVENNLKGNIHTLPSWYCHLITLQFNKLEENLKHRQAIALIYANNLNKKVLSQPVIEKILNSSNLRFPIFISNRQKLLSYLKKYGIYLSDVWYDSPIAPKKYLHSTDYKNQCPGSEKISSEIINLPTHSNTCEKDAIIISQHINKFVNLQARLLRQ